MIYGEYAVAMKTPAVSKKGPVKISANLSQEVLDALRNIAKTQGISMTEALRRAISTEKFLLDQVQANSKILIEDKDKNIRQILVR
jgi:hypothetical protein